MSYKDDLKEWVRQAVNANGGSANLVEVARHIWTHHEHDLRGHRDGFYTWQYDMRWAAQDLRDEGIFVPADQAPRGIWKARPPA